MSLPGEPPPDVIGPPLSAVYTFKARVYRNLQMRMRAKREDQDKRRKAHLEVQQRKRHQQQQLLQLFVVLAADRDRDCADRSPLTALPLDVLYYVIERVWLTQDCIGRRPESLHALVRFIFDHIREIRSKLFWSDGPLRILEQRQRTEPSGLMYHHFQLYERPPAFRLAQQGMVVEEGTRRVKQCCSGDLPRFYYSLIQPMYYSIRGAPSETSYAFVWPSYCVEP